MTWNSQNNTYLNGTGKNSALLKCPNPRFPFLYLASWSWTFWHWDISHVIWCELQSVISSQIKPPWPPYCRYCFFYRNSTCKLFLKKIGKKIIFAISRKKAFFLDFYSQAPLKCRTRTSFSPRITTSHRSRFKNRTKQVRFYLVFNYHLQFPNKNLASHGWRLRQWHAKSFRLWPITFSIGWIFDHMTLSKFYLCIWECCRVWVLHYKRNRRVKYRLVNSYSAWSAQEYTVFANPS